MKIFNRGNDAKAPPAPAGPAAAAASPPAVAAPLVAPPPPVEAAPPAPDLSVILDANVKEMSEKIAHLASTLETAQQERSGFESKLDQMDERMRKLSSLTEMISAQFNPFVGDAPEEPVQLPRADVGLAAPTPPGMAEPAAAMPSLALTTGFEGPALQQTLSPSPPFDEADHPALAQPLADDAQAPAAPAAEPGVYLWSAPTGFESSMLLLGWADMLLRTAGSRESLLDLVNYYHNIGWIGDPARDQVLAYADGIATPDQVAHGDWRADVELHEKSLLFVEKLRGIAQRRG